MTLMTSRKSICLHAGYTFAPSLAHCASGVLVTQVYILSVSLVVSIHKTKTTLCDS